MKTKICYECRKKFYCDENNTCPANSADWCFCPKCFKQKNGYNVSSMCDVEQDNWII